MSTGLTIEQLRRALGGDVTAGATQLLCPGPGHSPEDRSLSIKLDSDAPGGFVVHSFAGDDTIACRDYVRSNLGLPKPESKGRKSKSKAWTLTAEYIYRQADRTPYLQVRKCTDQNGKKQYPQAHWDGKSWHTGKLDGPKIPYRLPELAAAPLTTPVYFVEGEKDADNLGKLGFVATTASEGAAAKWDPALTPYFKDRHVVILPDADRPGRKHSQKVAKAISAVAASVKIVDLYFDRHDGSDVSDWLVDDSAGVRLVRLAKDARLWEPGADDVKDQNGDDDELIAELAPLSRLEYEKRRKEAADALGIRAAELDKIVAERRERKPEAEPALFEHWTVEPSATSVDSNALLRALVEKIRLHVVLSLDQAVAVALWIMFTWVHETAAVHSPILLITSPEANSGKSTLIGVIGFLARRALLSVSISGPALFRSIEKWHPTFVIDEADTVFVSNEDLREVVNSGWTRGQSVIRCDPESNEPRPYSTFAPKALGMKGRKLPDMTLSRTIIIEMQRKRPEEKAADFDHIDDARFASLRQQLLRWASDNAVGLARATPDIPPGFHNRVRANWKPLFAIAEHADSKQQAWQAAGIIENVKTTFDQSIGVVLLQALQSMSRQAAADCIKSQDMITELASDPEQPWGEYNKGKPITQRQLAKLLGQYKIWPGTVHPPGVAHGRGYKWAQFEEALERYLSTTPENPGFDPCERASADETGITDEKRSVQKEAAHGSKKDDLLNNHADLHACTDRIGKIRSAGGTAAIIEASNTPAAFLKDVITITPQPAVASTGIDTATSLAKVETPSDAIPAFLRRCVQCGAPGDAAGGAVLEIEGLWLHQQCADLRRRRSELAAAHSDSNRRHLAGTFLTADDVAFLESGQFK